MRKTLSSDEMDQGQYVLKKKRKFWGSYDTTCGELEEDGFSNPLFVERELNRDLDEMIEHEGDRDGRWNEIHL